MGSCFRWCLDPGALSSKLQCGARTLDPVARTRTSFVWALLDDLELLVFPILWDMRLARLVHGVSGLSLSHSFFVSFGFTFFSYQWYLVMTTRDNHSLNTHIHTPGEQYGEGTMSN